MHALIRKIQSHAVSGIVAVAILTGCAAETTGVPEVAATSQEVALLDVTNAVQAVDLGSCDSLAAPAGSHLVAHHYAKGDQVYFWTGTQWLFIGPSAVLYADEAGHGVVGVHEVAQVWESQSGSKVVGLVQRRCSADQSAIDWQLLSALGRIGPGIFEDVDYIQRVRTEGGLAPVIPGGVRGEQQRVPYSAEYLFYRAKR